MDSSTSHNRSQAQLRRRERERQQRRERDRQRRQSELEAIASRVQQQHMLNFLVKQANNLMNAQVVQQTLINQNNLMMQSLLSFTGNAPVAPMLSNHSQTVSVRTPSTAMSGVPITGTQQNKENNTKKKKKKKKGTLKEPPSCLPGTTSQQDYDDDDDDLKESTIFRPRDDLI
jgi:hypothetical protein